VARQAVDFLTRSVRPDGSWPIDTNLATWLTTLSVNALVASALGATERREIRDWLLGQQYRRVHPYTGAEPGAWAWTDLPGGVPDADDTAGAVLALRNLGEPDEEMQGAAEGGIRWLLNLQNRDGGVPTFCRGWGALPFDRSGADLTAHALLAWRAWEGQLSPSLAAAVRAGTVRAVRYLERVQRPDGAWIPLWFGNQHAPEEENPTYGTARVLPALLGLDSRKHPAVPRMIERGVRWLLDAQGEDGGWGGAAGAPPSVEETGLAVQALALAARHGAGGAAREAVRRGAAWLVQATDGGQSFEPSPIGFYFARLWYFEREYPLTYAVGGLERACELLAETSD